MIGWTLFHLLVLPAALVSGFQQPHVFANRRGSTWLNAVVEISIDEWKEKLSPEQFYVLREEGTEAPNSSELNFVKEQGTFTCAGCGAPLFVTSTKFDSGTGWPSFYAPIDSTAVETSTDFKLILPRTECSCSNCGGHLGHVFDDGPEPTGQRFCLNGVAMKFTSEQEGPELVEIVTRRKKEMPYKLSFLTQVLPSIATNGLFGALFFNSFLQTLQVHGGTILSPLDIFPVIPAVYFGVKALQSLRRAQ